MSARIYYRCPDCGGASCEQAERRDEDDARHGIHGLYKLPICPRCGDTGTLPPGEMTAAEIEAVAVRIDMMAADRDIPR